MTPILAALFAIILNVSDPLNAYASSGSSTVLADGNYFTVEGFRGVDPAALLRKLNYDVSSQVDTFFMDGRSATNPERLLSDSVDAIYREVETILGLEVSSFHGKIVVCPDQRGVGEEFHRIFGMGFEERSFFVLDEDTIFISFEDMTLGMLGHEIAHAIISHYFVVPPPTKVQEVLAGYVEYSLRKTTQIHQ